MGIVMSSSYATLTPPREVLKTYIRAALINEKAQSCPMAVRLAFHAAGTYDRNTGMGGLNGGFIDFSNGQNAGLSIMRDMLEEVKRLYPTLSRADIWGFAGCAAIEFCGGPEIPFMFGRREIPGKDALTSYNNAETQCPVLKATGTSNNNAETQCPVLTAKGKGQDNHPSPDLLPNGSDTAHEIRCCFNRMGMNDQEIVALCGAHTLGSCHLSRSGYEGQWTGRGCGAAKFNNDYFVNLMTVEWSLKNWDGPTQYEDPSGTLIMLPSDLCLKTDPSFAKYAQLYAEDERAFFNDFSAAFSKLLHLGCEYLFDVVDAPATPGEDFRKHAMHGNLIEMQKLMRFSGKDQLLDVNQVEVHSGRTALHKAAFWNHAAVVDYLIRELYVDPDIQDRNGDTALHDAAQFGHTQSLQLLAPVTNQELTNDHGVSVKDLLRGDNAVEHTSSYSAEAAYLLHNASARECQYSTFKSKL